jgi:hypothetical protein
MLGFQLVPAKRDAVMLQLLGQPASLPEHLRDKLTRLDP